MKKIESKEAGREFRQQKDNIEYSFWEGVLKITDKIREILDKQQYVIVAFNSSGANVGKTELSKNLLKELFKQNINSRTFHGLEEIKLIKEKICGKMVFLFEQLGWNESKENRRFFDKQVANALSEINCSVKGVDIWIGIYRPDLPFVSTKGEEILADIMIKNESATDKYKLNSGKRGGD